MQFFHLTEHGQRAVVLVSVFGLRDEDLYTASEELTELMEYHGDGALRVIDAKSIRSVVGMPPQERVSTDEWLHDHRHLHEGRKYVVAEKLGFEIRMGSRDPEMDIDE